MSTNELYKLIGTNGEEVLMMYRYCFDASMPLVISTKLRVNRKEGGRSKGEEEKPRGTSNSSGHTACRE